MCVGGGGGERERERETGFVTPVSPLNNHLEFSVTDWHDSYANSCVKKKYLTGKCLHR